MKTLIVQLARLGDIYQTWPTLNAMLRADPERELHLLVRERFSGATVGLDSRVKVHEMPTASILAPILRDTGDRVTTESRLSRFVDSMEAEGFDQVINLSFSPFSSYLTNYLQLSGASVVGYSRHVDGFFSIPDDISAYFYAQVGTHLWNRYHLSEIFASVAGVELKKQDWVVAGSLPFFERVLPTNYIVLHVGASQEHKTWPAFKWQELLETLVEKTSYQFVVVGGNGEDEAIANIALSHQDRILNLVGKTRVCDLLFITKWADLCVGGDSVVMHAASLSDSACLNLSCQSVNFWETGPVSTRSQIIWSSDIADIPVSRVVESVCSIVENSGPVKDNILLNSDYGPVKFDWINESGSDFEWKLIKALYTGEDFPIMEDPVTFQSFYRLKELTELAVNAINKLAVDESPNPIFVQQMGGLDVAMDQVGRLNPAAGILVRWFTTEKLRLPPGDYRTLVESTLKIYSDLNKICRVFVGDESYQFEGGEIYAE